LLAELSSSSQMGGTNLFYHYCATKTYDKYSLMMGITGEKHPSLNLPHPIQISPLSHSLELRQFKTTE
jgi:hypothetical protein